jgi:pimeloyl-ACP methyl ester carboxylesterase
MDAAVYRAAWRERGALTGGLNYYRAMSGTRHAAGAPLAVPTIVVWGERDRYLRPGLLDGLERHVRTLEVVRVPDATHWIVHEQPELVSAAILRHPFARPSLLDDGNDQVSPLW